MNEQSLNSGKLAVPAREAARMLSISERSLWAITSPRGDLPCVRVGRSVRYDIDALRRWLASKQEAAKCIKQT